MIPQTQAIVGNKTSPVRGDCFRAAVASILERDQWELPHVVELERRHGWHIDLMNQWLRREGYECIIIQRHVDLSDGKTKLRNPGYWIASVDSKIYKGSSHAIVMREDKISFDPSPRVGTLAYDRKPYHFDGWYELFVAPDASRCRFR